MTRLCPEVLERIYKFLCDTPSDINEHLPLLRKLAERCEHVTEFGTRDANGSTIAFLAAQPAELITWDVDTFAITGNARNLNLANLARANHESGGRTYLQPRCGDTLKILIEPTDLLFIDTLHTGRQLLSELERHADPIAQTVRKYLVFHDTHAFGVVGEDGKPGLRTAIRQFQRFHAFPLWKVAQGEDGRLLDLDNNNGLVVLEHVCAEGHSTTRRKNRCVECGQLVEE